MEFENVSLCLPIYKPNRKYLSELAESIRNQTYKDFELIISDDGDDKNMIVETFKGIEYCYVKNKATKGIFGNLNNAIKESSGNFIQVICQDDILQPDMIIEQANTLINFPNAGLVYTQVDHINEHGERITKNLQQGVNIIDKKDLINYYFIYGCLPGNLSTVMFRRSVLQRSGLFDEELKYAADFDYWIKLADKWDLAINYKSLLLLRTHSKQASFTLSNEIHFRDINKIALVLYRKSSLTAIEKYLYINKIYGCSAFIRCTKESLNKKNLSAFSAFIFGITHPFNIFLIIVLMPFKNQRFLNLKYRFPFPKPIVGIAI